MNITRKWTRLSHRIAYNCKYDCARAGGVRPPRRTEPCARGERPPGIQGIGRPKWIVCRSPAPSPGGGNSEPAGRTSRRRHGPPRRGPMGARQFPGPGFPRRTGPARVHLALRAAVLPPAAAPPARERKAESRRRAFPLRLQSAEWRPARVGSHAALGPSKVSGDVGPCVAGERGPGLATLTCGKATPACACWYARAE